MSQTGYLAPLDLENSLKSELKGITYEYGRLIIARGPPQNVHWAQNIWYDPQLLTFQSISEASKKLRELQKLWAFYPYKNIRRGELIAEKLPYFSPKPISFPSAMPKSPLGSWTLLDEHTLLASPRCSSPFANGEVYFQENKTPPSRAYLKLWESLTRAEKLPTENETCLEVGASPGSWTWVLQQLGTNVIAVDRAPLDPSVASLPRVTFMKKDAFSLGPEDLPKLDWIFSDVICYPEKLLSWIEKWLQTNPEINFICTIKFQGDSGYDIVKEFEKIKGSKVIHLFNNKHELTWFKLNEV